MPTALTVSKSAASSPGFAAGGHPVGAELDAAARSGASRLVMASATAMRPDGGAIDAGQRRALAHGHGLAGKAR